MSDIEGELARVRGAFDKPTLRLLDRKWAPFVLAVFRSSFSRDQQSIQADRLHTQVDTYMDELRAVGVDIPGYGGRALCLQWMNDQWLYRATAENGEEQYSLTSHVLEAKSLVDSMSKVRALISESRLATILATVRQWATEANPDREVRIRRLDEEIAEKTSERDRLSAGGEIVAASDDRMIDGYANLIDLIAQLPSDFKRVEESVEAMHRRIISAFREEERPIGEVLDEYLAKTDTLMSGTAEGRAFGGAFKALLQTLAGTDDLALLPRHAQRLHFTYLDPEYRAAGGRTHDSATVGDPMSPAYWPEIVIISENKDTAIHFSPLRKAISVEGAGFGGAGACASFRWITSCQHLIYWGDMDASGLEIVDLFRRSGVTVSTILMDTDAYETYERFGSATDARGYPLTVSVRKNLWWLTGPERALYEQLTDPNWARVRRIEQERIPLTVALAAVLGRYGQNAHPWRHEDVEAPGVTSSS